ncbi:hypothetical protein [Sphingopyxis sp. 550A]
MSEPASAVDAKLDLVFSGQSVDWKGARIPAEKLKSRLFSNAHAGPPFVIGLNNAVIDGDLLLDEIGESSGPLSLQILGCRLGQFRARTSHWRQLVIANSRLDCIDLPQMRVDHSVAIELCKVKRWLEMRESRVGGTVSLCGSSFAGSDDRGAVVATNALIEGDFAARDVRTRGCFVANRIDVGGSAFFDGAELDGRDAEEPKALDLARARVAGSVRLCPGKGRFIAHGRIHVDSADFGAMAIKAAKLDGCGQPAIVGDQLQVRETLDISGLTSHGLQKLEVEGALRFGSSIIGRQIQCFDAAFSGADELLVLHNCRVGGDVMIGHASATTSFAGTLNVDLCDLEGRLILESLDFSGDEAGANARQARIAKEITCYNIRASGPLRLDNSEANGLQIENVELVRTALPTVRDGLPEAYSHPEDVLLELMHIRLRSDMRLQNVVVTNGNIRMGEATIGGGAQFSVVSVDAGNRLALIAQGAKIGGGFQLAGTPQAPAMIGGELSLMGATIAGDLTFSHVRFGTAEAKTRLNLHNAAIAAGVVFHECELHGVIVGSSARFGGDCLFHSTRLLNRDEVTCDLRGVRVEGKLQWATTFRSEDEVTCVIDGHVTLDGATLGSLSWKSVELVGGSNLVLINIKVDRRIDGEHLLAGEDGRIDLSGTTTPLLVDRFGRHDSWGETRLGLDNFAYGQLANPSGGNGDTAKEITRLRTEWLDRRFDPTSARPARHLASILRQQGLFEASRTILESAFTAEGAARPTVAGRLFAHIFGTLFGHGLSGTRAALTILLIWVWGVSGTLDLKRKDLFIAPAAETGSSQSCSDRIDPFIYPLDVMIPLDFGEESRCVIGAGKRAELQVGYPVFGNWTILGTLPAARTIAVLYKLLAWIALSLAIATWSGLFKRAGRE